MTPLQRDLLAWGLAARRDLPWRRTRDPWAVLVSELMLQQTQVARVVPRYQRFLTLFPSPTACAAAPVGEAVRAWEGLGYNRRAVNLHRAATAMVEHHGGQVPATVGELVALPGIGPYTSRAVLVFAHEHDIGLVDTNAGRFLARAGAGRALRRTEAQDLADHLVPHGEGWAWGQAVFDLGAEVCTKREPGCHRCPIAGHCAWVSAGRPAPDPVAGSAGVSTGQSRFEGSDRQGRGRLVEALRHRPVDDADLAAVMGWPAERARAARVAATLVADGLVELRDGRFVLP